MSDERMLDASDATLEASLAALDTTEVRPLAALPVTEAMLPVALAAAEVRMGTAAGTEPDADSATPTDSRQDYSPSKSGDDRLTSALTGGPCNGLSSLFGRACLLSAVADTVGPVGLRAEAASVTRRAHEFRVGNASHVVAAQRLCPR